MTLVYIKQIIENNGSNPLLLMNQRQYISTIHQKSQANKALIHSNAYSPVILIVYNIQLGQG